MDIMNAPGVRYILSDIRSVLCFVEVKQGAEAYFLRSACILVTIQWAV